MIDPFMAIATRKLICAFNSWQFVFFRLMARLVDDRCHLAETEARASVGSIVLDLP